MTNMMCVIMLQNFSCEQIIFLTCLKKKSLFWVKKNICSHEKFRNIITHIILVIQVPNQSVARDRFLTSIEHHVKFIFVVQT